ncbi:MAG: molybdopterin-binding protein [Sphingomonas sp. 28-62-20]|uniref:molybdopterin-dependent oxidoreductase n=1 Tax=Sphingomonas sp. 28-62-20 TaxID=1970433 RepID=UPI000BDDCEF4|nr:MAG: molybdopterin-binding protein [Sphingomonas sp. 28-62-20]
MSSIITRRALVTGAASGAGLLLSGCDKLAQNETFRKILFSEDEAHRVLQRAISSRHSLAKEFTAAEMSPVFRANGTLNPGTPAYSAMAAEKFANWKLQVDGLVNRPLALSLAQLQQMPARTQITRHDCVEGWSAIGKWHGPMLGNILKAADVKTSARYIIFHCADLFHGNAYYTSIDMFDAFHPQTILAYTMNDAPITVPHGAPIRLRAERHLGYKQAKYVMRLQAVASLDEVGLGKGGYWEDHVDYDTYAGI